MYLLLFLIYSLDEEHSSVHVNDKLHHTYELKRVKLDVLVDTHLESYKFVVQLI